MMEFIWNSLKNNSKDYYVMAMKYLPQPMSEKKSSDAEILVRKSHERIKSYFKNDFVYDRLPEEI